MKKLYKISFCFVSVFVIVFSMFPLSAFASNPQDFSVSYNKPDLTGNDFFVELLLYNDTSNEYHVSVVYVNSVIDSDFSGVDHDFKMEYGLQFNDTTFVITFNSDNLDFQYFGVEVLDNGWAPGYFGSSVTTTGDFIKSVSLLDYGTGFRCINFHVYGDVSSVSSNLSPLSGSPNIEFNVIYSESQVIYSTLTVLGRIINMIYDQDTEAYKDFMNILDDIYNQGSVTQGHITDILSVIRIAAADLILIRDDLEEQKQELIDQGQTLDDINSELYSVNEKLTLIQDNIVIIRTSVEEIESYVVLTYFEVTEIKDYLIQIFEILNSGSDKEQPTKQDPTQFDDYYDVENSLIGNPDDVSDVVKVELNNNAMSVIWKLVEDFLNSHGKVIGFVLTILSFGLIALILGR